MSVKVKVFLYVFYVFGAALTLSAVFTCIDLLFSRDTILQFVTYAVLCFIFLIAFLAFIARVFDLEKN